MNKITLLRLTGFGVLIFSNSVRICAAPNQTPPAAIASPSIGKPLTFKPWIDGGNFVLDTKTYKYHWAAYRGDSVPSGEPDKSYDPVAAYHNLVEAQANSQGAFFKIMVVQHNQLIEQMKNSGLSRPNTPSPKIDGRVKTNPTAQTSSSNLTSASGSYDLSTHDLASEYDIPLSGSIYHVKCPHKLKLLKQSTIYDHEFVDVNTRTDVEIEERSVAPPDSFYVYDYNLDRDHIADDEGFGENFNFSDLDIGKQKLFYEKQLSARCKDISKCALDKGITTRTAIIDESFSERQGLRAILIATFDRESASSVQVLCMEFLVEHGVLVTLRFDHTEFGSDDAAIKKAIMETKNNSSVIPFFESLSFVNEADDALKRL